MPCCPLPRQAVSDIYNLGRIETGRATRQAASGPKPAGLRAPVPAAAAPFDNAINSAILGLTGPVKMGIDYAGG